MTSKWITAALGKAGILASTLLFAASAAMASSVTLVAGPTSTTLPDGQTVPMWGYTCGDAATAPVGASGASVDATCTTATGSQQTGTSWQPPVITLQKGKTLTINLVNGLSFATTGQSNDIPTSLVIVGQLGGGLGAKPQRMPSPVHGPQGTTWPGVAGGTDVAAGDAVFTPPLQADRVRSFGTEIAANNSGPLVWSNLRAGTYLIESGTQPSIQGAMGLYGVLVVTEGSNTAYGTTYDKDVPLLLSEIDPVQNAAVDLAVRTPGFVDTKVWNGQTGECGDPAVHTCYPPAVNYSPLYYLINGVAFDRTNAAASTVGVDNGATQGKVLLRMVNAGLRMHVPNVVGAPMTLLAEDGNKLPGLPRVQNSVFLAAGKTYDVVIKPAQLANTTDSCTNLPCYSDATYAVFDRQLSLSTANQRDGGMQAYIKVGAGGTDTAGSTASATNLSVNNRNYFCSAGVPLVITDPSKGLLAGSVGANGVAVTGYSADVSISTLKVQANGTFSYTPSSTSICGGSFTYMVNGIASKTATATITQCDVNNGDPSCLAIGPVAKNVVFTSNIASRYASVPPGVLGANVTNEGGLKLTATVGTTVEGGTVAMNADGSFLATKGAGAACPAWAGVSGTNCVTFDYLVKNTQGRTSTATAAVIFQSASNLTLNVVDAKYKTATPITDYRWIIEEDRTFWIDPKCQVNSNDPAVRPASCPPLPVESLGYNFHTANMPVVAQGCMGTVSCESSQTINNGTPAVCDVGNGICRTDADKKTPLNPGDVHLDPNKRYFISILPGDGVNPTIGGAGGPSDSGKPFSIIDACGPYTGPTGAWEPAGSGAMCGHEMGGAQIAPGQTTVNIALQETPLPTAKIAVFVFQDDNPLNGENDAGGGVDIIAPNEPGLGGFEIKLFDQAGGLGDNTGQITYDMFNQPVANALAGKIDPWTGLDSCPITKRSDGISGGIPTCPKYESDGSTPSPLAGQAVIANLYPGLYEIQAYPAADRIANGEEWLQTNTLDGGKPHEAFIKPNEPGYFQEFGPGGFHVSIGYANPKVINDRKAGICANMPCNATLNVQIANNHMSRTPDQRTYSSETYDHYSFTQCYVSVGPSDGEDFAFEKCAPDGTVSFKNMPTGVFKMTVFDQWNDIMLDGLVSTVTIDNSVDTKVFPVTQWRTNLFTRTFIDANGDGVSQETEQGLPLVSTNIRYRDGSYGFFNNTDLNGYAGFNEVFPFMSWLVVETTSTRFKPTGVHTVYDAGGPVDCSKQATALGMPCSDIAANIANTKERVPLPTDLRVPGGRYCNDADCKTTTNDGLSSGTVFPPQPWGNTQGWQGLLGQNSFMEFGVKPFVAHENGGIHGNVIYASTRPFDDPSLSLQLQWEPGVPRVKINLYQKSVDDSGNEKLTLVDSTLSTSFDDWAQGFRRDANGELIVRADGTYIPNMNCPGQDATSPFFSTLKGSKQWLDTPDASGNKKTLAYNSQFKCYDGWSQLNQIQPVPYDGMYNFPSVTAVDPITGRPTKTNCTICVTNPDDEKPMLPSGKYVVEVVVPPGYELVKEEDKNILLGDVYVAPVTQQFAGFGNIFIMPDQASVNSAYNPKNPGGLNKTTGLGSVTFPRHEGDTGSVEAFWPCVGAERIVPDLNSLFPQAGQAAPFAGAKRRLCDRKEVALDDQSSVLAKFYVFSSTHIAGHFTGTMTNDFASEFDPFSPQFGEKFGPPNLPVGLRDFTGNEVARVYADQWGLYNGLFFSSWSVNPPNPTGYAPQMSIACMNDPGPIADPSGAIDLATGKVRMITDPAYNPAYSNFCYETPFMPGFTAYMDTPVIPTQAFADQYNLPDTEYPDGTPAVKSVISTAANGPWVPVSGAVTAVTGGNNRGAFTAPAVPTVNFNNGTTGGSGAAATAVMRVNTALCSNCGSGTGQNRYSAGTPTLTLSAPNATYCATNPTLCVQAQATAQMIGNGASRRVGSINVTVPGSGYVSLPSVTVSCTGTCSQQTAVQASIASLSVNSYLVTNGGSGYTGTPTVSLAPAGNASVPTASVTVAPIGSLTITALGDKVVQNPNFAGPNAATSPFNQKTITRHYGFGSTIGTVALVDSNGVSHALTNVTWNDNTITGGVPSGLPNCAVQQQGGGVTQCGELVITAANGKHSIDAITVTAGGTAPWIVTESAVTPPAGKSVKNYTTNFGRMFFSPIQTAIDSASPGDLILVQPGTYKENLIMWKPVRLQGVGAGSVTINADAHPAGKMDQWRRQMNCVFGLSLDGIPNLNNTSYNGADPLNSSYSCPPDMHQRVDRIPFEAIVGWDASGNGNLAQVLQEPTLMGAYEGAGITVVGRGVRIPGNSTDFWGVNATGGAGAFTDGSVYLGNNAADCATSTTRTDGLDYGTGNFFCNPSRIDGVSIMNSSQGGGGVFIHGWGHNLEVANTRISGNHGTLAGAINLGNGETPDAFINDGVECGRDPVTGAVLTVMPCPPITWNGHDTAPDAAIPFQFNTLVRIHHNMLYNNASVGDALFSGTPAGAGGVTVSAGSDGYQIDHNWVAGNLSTGDGGGLQHLGLSFYGKINNNYVLFNQSTNPTLPTSGGGIVIEGANLDRLVNGVECGSLTDVDCPPGLGEGTGTGLVLDGNLIIGNSAESGTGGGLRIQQVNGTELGAFQNTPSQWYDVTVTNNIIANNVAGWDGAGVSIQDALKVNFVNNTVVSNDTTASAGSLFKTLASIMSNTPPPGCTPTSDPTLPQNPNCEIPDAPHSPQPAGLVAMAHTPNLIAAMGPSVTCPTGFDYSAANNGNCRAVSLPKLVNDLFWQNRAFSVNVVDANGNVVSNQGTTTPTGTGLQSQQNLVALTPALNQTATGGCAPGANYWDVGFREDPNVGSAKLVLTNSILTSAAGVTGSGNIVPTASPVLAQQCNGARTPPESCTQLAGGLGQSCHGFNAPAGASESTGLAQVFVFNGIKPTATVDEGHNWLNLVYGPLTLNRSAVIPGSTNAPELMVASADTGTAGGAYSIAPGSIAQNRGAVSPLVPAVDYFGNQRLNTAANPPDIGAVELAKVTGTLVTANPAPLLFTDAVTGTGTTTRDLVLTNDGTANFTMPTVVLSTGFTRVTNNVTGNCGTTLQSGASCTIRVQWAVPTAVGSATGTVTLTGVQGSPIAIIANAVGPTYTASVSPSAINFGNWKTGTSDVQTLTVTNTGNSPLTGFSAAAGSGVTATATARMGVNNVSITFNGIGAYSAGAPTVSFTAPACTINGTTCVQATASVQTSGTGLNRRVTGVTVTNAGAGYTTVPTVTFSAGSLSIRATGTATLKVVGLTVTTAGTGYTSAPTVSFNPNGASATASVSGGSVSGFTLASGGSYTQVPLVSLNGGNTGVFSLPTVVAPATACGATLAVSASCQINVSFAPANAQAYTGSVTLTAAGATITPASVPLTGAGVGAAATATASPNPVTIALSSVASSPNDSTTYSSADVVTLTNTSAVGGTSLMVSSVVVGNQNNDIGGFSNGPNDGLDLCTGVTLAPGASCSVGVRYTVSRTDTRSATPAGFGTLTFNLSGGTAVTTLRGIPTP